MEIKTQATKISGRVNKSSQFSFISSVIVQYIDLTNLTMSGFKLG
jgi:hypothetical protein